MLGAHEKPHPACDGMGLELQHPRNRETGVCPLLLLRKNPRSLVSDGGFELCNHR